MNTNTVEDANVINLYRALALLSVRKYDKNGRSLYNTAKKQLINNFEYKILFENFEKTFGL